MTLQVGDAAPAFQAPDQDGNMHALAEYAGKWLLLYFYPKDDTPGCTAEACGFRDAHPQASDRLAVVGVSADSVESHKKFAGKYRLPFTLLSDPERTVITQYGATPDALGKRVSFLIDPDGKIATIYTGIDTTFHAFQVLEDVKANELIIDN